MKNIYIHIDENGDKFYYKDKEMTIRHREDGPAIEWANGVGVKYWYINGKLHREDGPAIEYTNGYKEWYLNGKLHREDGPAAEDTDGFEAWYLNHEQFTKKEWLKRTSPTLEVTLDEVAAKFNVSVDKLKIKK